MRLPQVRAVLELWSGATLDLADGTAVELMDEETTNLEQGWFTRSLRGSDLVQRKLPRQQQRGAREKARGPVREKCHVRLEGGSWAPQARGRMFASTT